MDDKKGTTASNNFYDDDLIGDVMNIVQNDDSMKQSDFYLKEYNVVDEVSSALIKIII